MIIDPTPQPLTIDGEVLHPKSYPGHSVGITSGKGGVGKTFLALNLALALSRLGRQVALVDANMGLANIDLLAGINPERSLADVILDGTPLSEIIIQGPWGIKLVPGSTEMPELANLDPLRRRHFIRNLQDLRNYFDLLLIDTGTGLSRNVTDFVSSSDRTWVVATPEPTAVVDTYAMIKVIFQQQDSANIKLLVNMVRQPDDGREVFDKLNLVVSRFLRKEIGYLGTVPMDHNVTKAILSKQPLLDSYPRTHASKAIHQMARSVLGADLEQNTECRPSRIPRILRSA